MAGAPTPLDVARLIEPLGDGVVAVEDGEAGGVEHALGIDVAAAVDAPGHEAHPVVAPAGPDSFEGVGEVPPQAPGPQGRKLAQEDLGEQRVGEAHVGPPAGASDREQAPPFEVLEDVVPGDRRDHVEGRFAGDRQQFGGMVVGVVEPAQALGDELLERRRRLERTDQAPDAIVLGERAGIACGLDELAQHARVAHGGVAQPEQRLGDERSAQRPVQQRLDALLRQRVDVDAHEVARPSRGGRTASAPDVVRMVSTAKTLRDCTSELTSARDKLVELVAVVDEQQQAFLAGAVTNAARARWKTLARSKSSVPARRGDVDGQEVGEGGERDRLSLGVPVRPRARQPGRLRQVEDLLGEARLADAGAAGEEHAADRLVAEPGGERLELVAAPDHRPGRESPVRGSASWSRCRSTGRRRSRRLGTVATRPDRRDEAVAAAVDGLDDALLGAVVADGAAGRLDATRERRLADEAVAPDVVEQLVLADDAVAVLDEVGEDAEDLRLDRHGRAGVAQLEQTRVEVKCSEGVDQRPSS